MSDVTTHAREVHTLDSNKEQVAREGDAARKLPWETPKMEDVSQQVMAQPYIRFT